MRLLKMAGFLSLTVLAVLLLNTLSPRDANARFGQSQQACQSDAHRAFDFWVGDWVVYSPAGDVAGHNTIELVLGGCALHENWVGASGGEGHSYTFYDRNTGKWHQTWIDANGTALYVEGGWTGEAMVLTDGANRITWTPLDGGSVRQHWESSTDGGASWTTAFDGEYIPARQE